MLIQHSSSLWSDVHGLLPSEWQIADTVPYLSGAPSSKKTVIRFLRSDDSTPKVVLKASQDTGGQHALQREMNVLRFLQSRVQRGSYLGFSAPEPLSSFEHAGWHYTTETGAQGQPLSELIFLHSRRAKWGFLRHELLHALESAIHIPDAFCGQTAVRHLDASWYELPHTVSLEARTRAELESEIRRCINGELCCHGDFTIENVFWESASGKISVIDWELPLLGVPALYDAFTLLLSSLPALDLEPTETTVQHRLLGQFRAAFFGTGRWAAETRELLWSLTKGETSDLWLQMLVCLLIRSNYFLWRSPALGEQYARLLEFAGNHRQDFVFSETEAATTSSSKRLQ